MSYLIHSALLLAACYLYYRFVLRRETHFRLHRFVLLGCIVACFLLPLSDGASRSLRSDGLSRPAA